MTTCHSVFFGFRRWEMKTKVSSWIKLVQVPAPKCCPLYSGDLNSEQTSEWRKHLNSKLLLVMVPGIWIADWYSNGGLNTSLLIKWWSEYPTTMVPPGTEKQTIFCRTNLHDLNTKLVLYSDPHCILQALSP